MTATGSKASTSVANSYTSGSGGAKVTVGLGGAGAGSATGSETVNLSASTAAQDTLTVGAVTTLNVGQRVVVTGALESSSNKSDVLALNSKTAISNVAAGTATASTGTYAASNGVITFGSTESTSLNTQLADAQAIVNASGPSKVAMFAYGGDTYVVTSAEAFSSYVTTSSAVTVSELGAYGWSAGDVVYISDGTTTASAALASGDVVDTAHVVSALNTIATNSGGTAVDVTFSTTGAGVIKEAKTTTAGATITVTAVKAASDAIVQIKGVTGLTGFAAGQTTAGSSVVGQSATTLLTTGVSNVSKGTLTTDGDALDATGFSAVALAAAVASKSYTVSHLGSSAVISDAGTGGNAVTKLTVSQDGTGATNYLTYNSAAAHTVTTLQLSGTGTLLLNDSAATVYGTISDAGTTKALSTIVIGSPAYATTISTISATALTTVDASNAGNAAVVIGGTSGSAADATAVAGVTFKLGAASTSQVDASGVGDTFTQGTSTAAVTLIAAGAGDTITLSNGANNITAHGNADHITVGTGSNTIAANGAGDVIVAGGAGSTTSGITANGNGDSITLSGTGTIYSATGTADTITLGSGTTSSTTTLTTVSGASDVISTVSGGVTAGSVLAWTVSGNSATITAANKAAATGGASAITAIGTNDVIDVSGWTGASANVLTVNTYASATTDGVGSTIKLGTYDSAVVGRNNTVTFSNGGNNLVDVSHATTGAASSGSYALTTLNNAVLATDTIKVAGSGTGVFTTTAVDVSAATSLASALDIASTHSSLTATQDYVYWFQYGGNTYLVDNVAVGTSTTALGTSDVVVKLTGLIDLSHASMTSHVVTL